MNFQILAQSPVFRGIPHSELETLLADVNYKINNFKKGDIVAFREDRVEHLMILIKGSVKGEMLDVSGKTIKIEDIMAPYPIASAFIFGQRNLFPVDVTANEDVEIFYLPKSSMLELLQNESRFLTNFLNSISNRSQFLAQKVMLLNFKTIKGKLANYILNMAAPDKCQVTLPKSHMEMAQFFGVTRPSFARSLKEMEMEGLIKTNRREIEIIDRSKLIQLLHQ